MESVKVYFVDGCDHKPLNHIPPSQDHSNKTYMVNYIQKKENPEFHKIILYKDQAPAKHVFHCSVGCYLGLEICLLDANKISVDFSTIRWRCSGPFLTSMLQDDFRARAGILKPGSQVGKNNKAEFGWPFPGEFTLFLDVVLPEEPFSAECTIVVSEPTIEKLSIEMLKRPDDEDHAHGIISPELGPVVITSHINAEEVSGTFGFIQSTHVFLERSFSDGSEQVFQTPETFTTIQNLGIEKRVIKEAEHFSRFEKKALRTEYKTDFNKMFEKSECMEIRMKNNFRTFMAFQPDVDYFPGVTKTFIVKYVQDYLEWGWATNAIRDGASWKLQNPSWHSDVKNENETWRPAEWTKAINDKIEEHKWTAKK